MLGVPAFSRSAADITLTGSDELSDVPRINVPVTITISVSRFGGSVDVCARLSVGIAKVQAAIRVLAPQSKVCLAMSSSPSCAVLLKADELQDHGNVMLYLSCVKSYFRYSISNTNFTDNADRWTLEVADDDAVNIG